MATAAAGQVEVEAAVGGETEMTDDTGDGEERTDFAEVQRKRKRKLISLDMEVDREVTAAKRPSFPPVGASVTPVRHKNLSLSL